MPKIVDIEGTPNPNAIKFILKDKLSFGAPRSFNSPAQAADEPLAASLFAIPHVTSVYWLDNWLTVTQDGQADWYDLQREIAVPIREAPAAVPLADSLVADKPEVDPADEDMYILINELLDQHVRPALENDGGGIEVVSLKPPRLTLRYHGACGSCPSSLSGTLGAIERLLHTVDPDLEVVVV